jgi:hypothetical protein
MTTNTQPTSLCMALLGLALTVATGCTQSPKCDELGTCGGNPTGDWLLSAGHPSCSESLYRPALDPRLVRGDQPPARIPLPDEAFYDWCDLLTFKTADSAMYDANHVPTFSSSDPQIGAAWVRYGAPVNGGGAYTVALTTTGTYVADYPPTCIRGFGAKDDPVLGPVCTQLQTYLTAKGTAARNIACITSLEDPQACTCQFDISRVNSGSGTYAIQGNTIVHALTARMDGSAAADFPASATYCAESGGLQLTGKDGAYLFNQAGLRTLDLGAATINCADGAQGPGEEGVDCGLACNMPCMP